MGRCGERNLKTFAVLVVLKLWSQRPFLRAYFLGMQKVQKPEKSRFWNPALSSGNREKISGGCRFQKRPIFRAQLADSPGAQKGGAG